MFPTHHVNQNFGKMSLRISSLIRACRLPYFRKNWDYATTSNINIFTRYTVRTPTIETIFVSVLFNML
jgi:hypothetical protein